MIPQLQAPSIAKVASQSAIVTREAKKAMGEQKKETEQSIGIGSNIKPILVIAAIVIVILLFT